MTYSKSFGYYIVSPIHDMIRVFFLIVCLILAFSTQFVYSQASLVPVYHPVYDWLHYQRVRGNAPLYNYEALPLTRGQITKLLNAIETSFISTSDERNRQSFIKEFSVDSLKKQKSFTLFQGPGKFYERWYYGIISDIEPHFYVWDNSISTIAIDVFTSPSTTLVKDGKQSYNSPFYVSTALRTYGTLSKIIGFHYEQYTVSNSDDLRTFQYVPFFGRNAKYLLNKDSMNHFESFVGYHKEFWSIHVGRGLLKYGVGRKNNLVYSREGIPFDWLRLNIDTKYFKYSFIHGFLSWPIEQTLIDGLDNVYTKAAPSRYTVHQRIQFQPAHWITFSYYDLVNYSNREIELTYLNPVNRLAIMEFEQDDQDNGFVGFAASIRPIKGLEIYAEMLIDDLHSTADLFRWNKREGNEEDNKSAFGRHLGASYATKTGQVFNVNYQRIDPSVYAHRFDLNAHSESGFGLGSQIGPNGDELSFMFDQWFSIRSRITLGYSFNRHGLNYFDTDGNFIDAGGDINDSYYFDPTSQTLVKASNFLDGDVHKWNNFFIELIFEPIRAIKFKTSVSLRTITHGEQLKDLAIFNFGVTLGE